MANRLTTQEFINKASEIHGGRYQYKSVQYINNYTKVAITCPIHGNFNQQPKKHLEGVGCRECYLDSITSTTAEFINKAVNIHGNKYRYDKVEYIKGNIKVCISCKKHGDFWQTPNNHIHKTLRQGCPKCGLEQKGITSRTTALKRKFKGLEQPEDYKLIPLTQGKFAKVSNEDFDKVKDINWGIATNGYVLSSDKIYLHRFLLNPPKGMVVDHINHDKLDNRREKLRVCTYQQNQQNRGVREGTSSKYKGVYWDKEKSKWCASITVCGKVKHLGYFSEEGDAGRAYDNEARIVHKEFYKPNIEDE